MGPRCPGRRAPALRGLDVEHHDRIGHAGRVVVVRDELSGVGEQQRMARMVLLALPPRRGPAVVGDVERGQHAVAAVVAHDDPARLVDDRRVRDQAVRASADLGHVDGGRHEIDPDEMQRCRRDSPPAQRSDVALAPFAVVEEPRGAQREDRVPPVGLPGMVR